MCQLEEAACKHSLTLQKHPTLTAQKLTHVIVRVIDAMMYACCLEKSSLQYAIQISGVVIHTVQSSGVVIHAVQSSEAYNMLFRVVMLCYMLFRVVVL
jgi:hypothetical protein